MERRPKTFVIEGSPEGVECVKVVCEACYEEYYMPLEQAEHIEFCPFCGQPIDLEFVDEETDIKWGKVNSQKKHEFVFVSSLPICDFCGKTAEYDAKTKHGPWANMCKDCFKTMGIRLGMGCGQRLVLKREE